ncbi:MAG: anti-sigma factor antagonist [Clostridia bacterium]|nr:anti-sigma factor antagonist [Clostridia bacterium]
MSVKIVAAQQKMTAYLDGEIDHHNAAFIREEIDNAVMASKPEVLKIDFDNVTFMDSSGIGLVMGRYRTLSMYGGKLIVSNLSPQFYRIMKLSGLEKIAIINKREK